MSEDTFFDVYSAQFFLNHTQEPHFGQTKLVGRTIAEVLRPRSVVDVGCGVGAMLLGVSEASPGTRCVGVESPVGVDRMRDAGAMRIPEDWYLRYDLRNRPNFEFLSALLHDGRFDVAISAEVAEHLPPECSESHVDLLAQLADVVVFTAAYPGQGGDQHINERPWTYWRDLFAQRGYAHDEATTARIVGIFRDQTTRAWGYSKNMRIYRKGG